MNFEELAARFMQGFLANPIWENINVPEDVNLYEHIAKESILAAHAFKKEIKASMLGAEDTEFEIINE